MHRCMLRAMIAGLLATVVFRGLGEWKDAWLVGSPVDVAPWCYSYRSDLAVQKEPEAYFIPHRLERLNAVYRADSRKVPKDQLKSVAYNMPDLLKPFPPDPRGKLRAGLLWIGPLADYRVELRWPGKPPLPSEVEVRTYPTAFGWFGWTVDKVLTNPEISADGQTWTYSSGPPEQMDTFYNNRIPAATQMIAVFGNEGPVPALGISGKDTGVWRRMDVRIEWANDQGGSLEAHVAKLGPITALDKGTRVNGLSWHAKPGARRPGITVPVLYAPGCPGGLDSRITVWRKSGGFTFSIKDLNRGPIYIPREGVYIAKASEPRTARQFIRELASKHLLSLRQLTDRHPEASSWEQLMREVRLWTCPAGTQLKPFPAVADPPMDVELPDPGWTAAWRCATNQLRGRSMWGGLAFEVGRVAHEMDMIGLHEAADHVYDHFLPALGAMADGDFVDGAGAFEWAKDIRNGMGYMHDGTHPSTGRLLFAMAERYFLTGDKAWFKERSARMRAAADWIIRQRHSFLPNIPNRKDLYVADLMPPSMLGDYAMPASDWHWYYVDNALSLQGIQRFGDALAEFAPSVGRRYQAEAATYRQVLRRALEREAALAPVRLGRDGLYHSYIPRMAYSAGLTGPEIGAPQFPDCDNWMGPLPTAEPYAGIDAGDPRMMDTLDDMEEMGTSQFVRDNEAGRRGKGLPTQDAWFWTPYSRLPKASHVANIYLLQDDVPSFLRFWENAYASIVGADGKLWEPWRPGNYDDCTSPDNGTAGWFMENFRNLLVMEDRADLWIARATPRNWLEQGKRITVKHAPTYFGDLSYQIVSDAGHGQITAVIDAPTRRQAQALILRLRHPRGAAMKAVTVNGKPWQSFDPGKETITLTHVSGKLTVVARY